MRRTRLKFIWTLLVLVTFCGICYAQEAEVMGTRYAKIIYKEGYLMNQGSQPALNAEIVSPFYRYLGDLKENETMDIRDIKTKFTLQYLTPQGLAEYEQKKEIFIPVFEADFKDIGLSIICSLSEDILFVRIDSVVDIADVYIEIPQEIPVRISEGHFRYILSSVGVLGQNLKTGKEANFKLTRLRRLDFYTVPVRISFNYKYKQYERLFLFSFTKDEVEHAAYDTGFYN